jgi:hypothetical protein
MVSRGAAIAAALALLLVLAALGVVSCSGGSDGTRRVTGEIVDVAPQSIDTFASLTIRAESGKLWTFGPARLPHFSPSHLIEHQANGDRITVVYREKADGGTTVIEIEE